VIAHIERGRDEVDRELPPPVYTLDTNIIIYYFGGEAPILAFLRQ
jgi:hypothetical protein